MSSTTHLLDREISAPSASELFLNRRLKVVEELWRGVLQQECGQELADLLDKMRDLCTPEGQASDFPTAEVLPLVEDLDLNDAIRVTRAFALYFQLINIVEQHYEQRDQQQQNSTAPNAQGAIAVPHDAKKTSTAEGNGEAPAVLKTTPLNGEAASKALGHHEGRVGTLDWLFPHLKRLNVPPRQIQRLIDQLDIQLV
ncbi:MAG: phosphoenolpyruvate carboxylase, partial [Cyanobacteria bacterium P01_H01_bin.130]